MKIKKPQTKGCYSDLEVLTYVLVQLAVTIAYINYKERLKNEAKKDME